MKKIVLTFGLIAGAVLSAMMLLTLPFLDQIGYSRAEVIGYATMVAAFLLVFFGVRAYRDRVVQGPLTFGRALTVGLLITLVSTVCYVATWELLYFRMAPGFSERYARSAIERARASGASAQEIEATRRQMETFKRMYDNPLTNAAITFLEPTPIGVLVSVISAAVLRKKR
jgi:hypothetical protein